MTNSQQRMREQDTAWPLVHMVYEVLSQMQREQGEHAIKNPVTRLVACIPNPGYSAELFEVMIRTELIFLAMINFAEIRSVADETIKIISIRLTRGKLQRSGAPIGQHLTLISTRFVELKSQPTAKKPPHIPAPKLAVVRPQAPTESRHPPLSGKKSRRAGNRVAIAA